MSRSEDSFCSSESIRTLLFSSSMDVVASKRTGGDMDNSQLEQPDGSHVCIMRDMGLHGFMRGGIWFSSLNGFQAGLDDCESRVTYNDSAGAKLKAHHDDGVGWGVQENHGGCGKVRLLLLESYYLTGECQGVYNWWQTGDLWFIPKLW